ncbi:MIP/aquaporin family protein [Fusibacter sp. 3D3]|uniref:MIP/aquaporin family protein n=1 Tax=Fusibacter sp. 3D3 TaxID=1048380 RepID=UPI00085610CC|nr:MIP/aquaporin family protein [Fusibacter sp. 3D3]GAU79065.1 glycerol uptake facilitator protein [Fusibacter sp. 3D3]
MLKKDNLFGELLAEFIGAFILIFIGAGSVASLLLNNQSYNMWDIGLMWGAGVTMAIYITGAVSGTHINPAVTITLAVFRDFPKKKVVPYIISQIAGCFTGALVTYALFRKAFLAFEATNGMIRGSASSVQTAGIFTTYPASYLSNIEAMFVEIAITAFLLMVILAIGDAKNANAPQGKYAPFGPILVGLTIAIIGGSFGSLTGFAMNPARDLGPKIFLAVSGWGNIGLPAPNNYFWVPIVGPIIWGLLGAVIYDKGVSRYIVTSVSESDSTIASNKKAA